MSRLWNPHVDGKVEVGDENWANPVTLAASFLRARHDASPTPRERPVPKSSSPPPRSTPSSPAPATTVSLTRLVAWARRLGECSAKTTADEAGSIPAAPVAARTQPLVDLSQHFVFPRVFKKGSNNGKLTVYLGKRDFVDHVTHVDPIVCRVTIYRGNSKGKELLLFSGDFLAVETCLGSNAVDFAGSSKKYFQSFLAAPSEIHCIAANTNFQGEQNGVVFIDPDYIKNRKVFGNVCCCFRYGREDLDVLGLTFRKELYSVTKQIYPRDPATERPITRLQDRLLRKLGPNAYPFNFELPPNCPASVTLQPAPGDTGKPCGVDYELKVFVGDTDIERIHRRNSVKLAIRKIMYAPSRQGEQPSTEVNKDFVMSPSKLYLEASLDKELYHHGETIAVNVHIANNSNRKVKKIKLAVKQFADICIFSTAQYKCTVAEIESGEGYPVGPGQTLSKVYQVKPLLADNKDKRGLALDGQLKHEDTNLASSTIVTDPAQKENLGIIVQYKVKVKLILGPLQGGDLIAELPFILMHPKPEEESVRASPTHEPALNGEPDRVVPVDNNLIQLEADNEPTSNDDDIIFEDFARLRLKGDSDNADNPDASDAFDP